MKLITEATDEKLRGGFYTPRAIAEFMLKWGINGSSNYDILEPSCGDGVFLSSIKINNFKYNSIDAIELNPVEAEKSRQLNLKNNKVLNEDFHNYFTTSNSKYDLVIGNPPYIRYQFFSPIQQILAEDIFIKAGLKYSKLTNAWVSFVVGSTMMLKKKGKIAFVLPAEILQVSYAKQLRQYLAKEYNKINIISFEKLVFPNIQQEVVLLLCEKNGTQFHNIDHIELKDADGLKSLDIDRLKSPKKIIDFNSNKWTYYFLDQEEIDLLETIAEKRKIKKIGDYAKVEVGITTGSNPFFTVPLETVKEYNLSRYAKPMVGRSVQVNSVIFKEEDWKQNKNSKARAHLLTFPSKPKEKQINGARSYIEFGEGLDIHTGYKNRIREFWYVVPSLKISDALFIRRNNLYPRLIINEANAYTTDTMHRVFLFKTTDLNSFTASYYNSLSLAFTEVSGRSHGGGVLELMPNEAERVLLPYHECNNQLLEGIDSMVRDKVKIEQILDKTDKIILRKNFNLTKKEINTARNIWIRLSSRRLNRGK